MQTALLIIDVQQLLCSGQWAAHQVDAMVERINLVAARARTANVPVFLIQHESADGPLQFASAGWQLYTLLEVGEHDVRVRKTATDSFYKTNLHALLQEQGITNLVICGLQSEFCVDSTVRGALAHGYPVTLLADGHSTLRNGILSAEQIVAHHNATLANVDSFGPRVMLCIADKLKFTE